MFRTSSRKVDSGSGTRSVSEGNELHVTIANSAVLADLTMARVKELEEGMSNQEIEFTITGFAAVIDR